MLRGAIIQSCLPRVPLCGPLPLMSVIVGIAGASRNAAAALCDGGRIVAVCEQERVTRTRRAGLRRGHLPGEAVEAVLRLGGRALADVSAYAVAEPTIDLPSALPVERVEHHYAHAATSFLTSPFSEAVVLVCDGRGVPELTVWRGANSGVSRVEFPWNGPAFATVYSRAAEAFGFAPDGDEHRLEALAHVADRCLDAALSLIAYRGDRLDVSPHFSASIAGLLRSNGSCGAVEDAARVAISVQRSVGECLLQLVRDVRSRFAGQNLCLGGGLFYNSYFNTLLAESAVYEHTFVPVNPGNAGVAVGAALDVTGKDRQAVRPMPLSAFLGPGYEAGQIKGILENCKLSYDYVHGGQMIDRAASALSQGKLVGWFQGRMEWGPRALGNRSIVCDPRRADMKAILNAKIKRRESFRPFAPSVLEEAVTDWFEEDDDVPFMMQVFQIREGKRPLIPAVTHVDGSGRLQTVYKRTNPRYHRLIESYRDLTGIPMVLNTSFNENEPVVCEPKEALDCFLRTRMDALIMGETILFRRNG
jgi:carbamoyltransferase